jgi:hypothetical protein
VIRDRAEQLTEIHRRRCELLTELVEANARGCPPAELAELAGRLLRLALVAELAELERIGDRPGALAVERRLQQLRQA